jgi:hypothetical protein
VTFRGFQHRSEKAVGDADGSVLERRNISRRDVAISFVEIDAVVAGKFAFQHYVAMDAVSETAAQSKVVGTGLRDVEIVGEKAKFYAALGEQTLGEQQCGGWQKSTTSATNFRMRD